MFSMKQIIVALLKAFSGWLEVAFFAQSVWSLEFGLQAKADRRFADWADKGIVYKMLDHFANNLDKRIYHD